MSLLIKIPVLAILQVLAIRAKDTIRAFVHVKPFWQPN
jgi:hypothetical protein